jgi:hypothetical protein
LWRSTASRRSSPLAAARVYVIDGWPITAPSQEAFGLEGAIIVNSRSAILRAPIRPRAYDIVLAALLLREDSHLHGATEYEAEN